MHRSQIGRTEEQTNRIVAALTAWALNTYAVKVDLMAQFINNEPTDEELAMIIDRHLYCAAEFDVDELLLNAIHSDAVTAAHQIRHQLESELRIGPFQHEEELQRMAQLADWILKDPRLANAIRMLVARPVPLEWEVVRFIQEQLPANTPMSLKEITLVAREVMRQLR